MVQLPALPSPSDIETNRSITCFQMMWLDWLTRLILALTAAGLIVIGHGCHPGGHDNDIDDELVYRNHSGG